MTEDSLVPMNVYEGWIRSNSFDESCFPVLFVKGNLVVERRDGEKRVFCYTNECVQEVMTVERAERVLEETFLVPKKECSFISTSL